MACICKDIEMGSYDAQVQVILPDAARECQGGRRSPVTTACIDACILPECMALWSHGIPTINSCCGHGDPDKAFIAVAEGYGDVMRVLGYRSDERAARPDLTFRSKSCGPDKPGVSTPPIRPNDIDRSAP